MNDRIDYLDTLRFIACFLVVLTHSTLPVTDPSMKTYTALMGIISSPSSELFLAISGALLIPVRQSTREFYARRFSKLIIPLLVWSLGLIICKYIDGSFSLQESLTRLLYLPLKPSRAGFWFMYVLIGLYLFAPILSKWLVSASKREVQFYLFLWTLTVCLPSINHFLPEAIANRDMMYDCVAPFSGFIGYMLLGYYCVNNPIVISSKFKATIYFGVCQIALFTILFLLERRCDHFVILGNLSIFSAIEVFLIINYIYNINEILSPVQGFFRGVTKYLFGVYLMHIIVLHEIVHPLFGTYIVNPIIQNMMMATMVLFLCLVFTYLISKIPNSKYIIGV